MRSYTLHVAAAAMPGEPEALDRAHLVRDGFSWGGFLFPALWFALKRCWIAALFALVVVGLSAAIMRALGIPMGLAIVVQVLIHVLFGLEAASLQRWTLERRGYPAVDAVVASDRGEAEIKAFGRWLAGSDTHSGDRPSLIPPRPAVSGPAPVLGLFPEWERRR